MISVIFGRIPVVVLLLLLLLLSFSFSFAGSSTASAYSGLFPLCSNTPSFSSYEASLKSQPSYVAGTTRSVLLRRDNTGYLGNNLILVSFWSGTNTKIHDFSDTRVSVGMDIRTSVGSAFKVATDGTLTEYDSSFAGSYGLSDVNCISQVNSGSSPLSDATWDFNTVTSSTATTYTGAINSTVSGANVTFDISNITPAPSSYIFNYGDGSTGTSLSHTYSTSGQKNVTFTPTPASATGDLTVYPVIAATPGNLHFEANVSGNQAAFTTSQTDTTGVTKIEYDFTSGMGTAYVDYSTTASPAVAYYSQSGWSIDKSLVNGNDVYSNQIQYQFPQTLKQLLVSVRTTDSAGYIKTMTLSLQLGTTGTTSFVNDNTLQGQAANANKPIVCNSWDIACFVSQGLKSFFDGFTSVITYLFVPNSSDISSAFSDFNTTTYGIASVIALPITSIAKLTTATCSPVVLSLPFLNHDVTLECMTPIYAAKFGALWVLLQSLLTGVVAYGVTINSIALVKRLKDPEDDKIEVFSL